MNADEKAKSPATRENPEKYDYYDGSAFLREQSEQEKAYWDAVMDRAIGQYYTKEPTQGVAE